MVLRALCPERLTWRGSFKPAGSRNSAGRLNPNNPSQTRREIGGFHFFEGRNRRGCGLTCAGCVGQLRMKISSDGLHFIRQTSFQRNRMGSGDPPGLQNRRSAGLPVEGAFDSHTLPPASPGEKNPGLPSAQGQGFRPISASKPEWAPSQLQTQLLFP